MVRFSCGSRELGKMDAASDLQLHFLNFTDEIWAALKQCSQITTV